MVAVDSSTVEAKKGGAYRIWWIQV